MRIRFYLPALLSLIACLWLSSCVTKGKYLISEKERGNLQSDSASTHRLLNECNAKAVALQAAKTNWKKVNPALENQNASTQDALKNTQKNLNATKADLENLSSSSKLTIEEQQRRLKSLEDLLQAQRDAMNKLKGKP